MKSLDVDVAIIGAGTAGMTAYRAASKHTDRLVVIESGEYGTTCARVGCMPSKLLIAAAQASHQVDAAAQFGIEVQGKSVSGKKVMQRVRSERDRFVSFVVKNVNDWPPEHRMPGRARFIDANTLQVDEHTRVNAARVVLAVGSRPTVPTPWQVLQERLLISDDVFSWQTLPESIAVVGTGVVGMELSQALARLGVKTHLFGVGNKFGPISDPAINKQMQEIFQQELKLSADSAVDSVSRTANGIAVSYQEDGETRTGHYDCLLAATGRRSNLDLVNLAAAGVELNDKGLPRFDDTTGQIADSTLFLAGDASTAHPLLHEAADDGTIAGDNAGRYPDIRVRPRRAPLSIIFTDPQIALVGASYAELQARGTPFGVGEVSFAEQGRSRVIGKNRGMLRVYGEPVTGRFLGAEMAGPAAEHIGHLLAWSVQHQLTVQQMLDSPYYHPVIEEGMRTALRYLNRDLDLGPVPVERCLDCGPGA